MSYLFLKWLHVLSSTFLFGTGVGSAFYLFFVTRSRDVHATAVVCGWVVIADWMFTATTAVFQPLSGWWMARMAGMSFDTPWLAWSIALYVLAIACWLPVVWLQMRLRDVARAADAAGRELPPEFWRLRAWWVGLGFPALFAFLAIFWLMIAKPA